MQVSYDYYRIFYYVAKYRSFTQAANILMNNQPNVTRAIKNLEHSLGCILFVRSNRGVRLTPEGEKLYGRVAIAFDQIQAGEAELSSDKSMNGGFVSVGMCETALHGLLLPVFNQYHQKYPNVRLRMSSHSTPQAIQALRGGLVDFAVMTTPIDSDENLRVIPIKSFQDIPVCGPAYSHLTGREISLGELCENPIVSLAHDTKTYEFYSRLFLGNGFVLKPDIEVSTTMQMLSIIKYNLGIGFLPDIFALNALAKKDIFPIRLSESIPRRHLCIIKRMDMPLGITARELEKMIIERAKG